MSQRVLVLGEHRFVAAREPGEEIGGDPLVVCPVLAVGSEGRAKASGRYPGIGRRARFGPPRYPTWRDPATARSSRPASCTRSRGLSARGPARTGCSVAVGPACSCTCQRPAVSGPKLVPGQVLRIAGRDATHVGEHDGGEVELLEDESEPVHESARPSSNVSSSGRGGSSTGLPADEVDERLQPDRLIAGMLDHRHLLRKVVRIDAV